MPARRLPTSEAPSSSIAAAACQTISTVMKGHDLHRTQLVKEKMTRSARAGTAIKPHNFAPRTRVITASLPRLPGDDGTGARTVLRRPLMFLRPPGITRWTTTGSDESDMSDTSIAGNMPGRGHRDDTSRNCHHSRLVIWLST